MVLIPSGPYPLTVVAQDAAGNTTSVTRTVYRWDVPSVEITAPADLTELATTTVEVTGTFSAGVTSVQVNSITAELSGNSFIATGVPLVEGGNTLTATVTDASGLQATDTVHVVRDLTPPRVVVDHPRSGAILDDPVVDVWGLVHDIVPGTVNASEASVTVKGLPAEVRNCSFRVADLPLPTGDNDLMVTAVDAAGNTAQIQVTIRRAATPVARVRAVSGGGQAAVVGEPLPEPLVVEILDGAGDPVVGETVLFKVEGSDGTLDGGAHRVAVETDPRSPGWCWTTPSAPSRVSPSGYATPR